MNGPYLATGTSQQGRLAEPLALVTALLSVSSFLLLLWLDVFAVLAVVVVVVYVAVTRRVLKRVGVVCGNVCHEHTFPVAKFRDGSNESQRKSTTFQAARVS